MRVTVGSGPAAVELRDDLLDAPREELAKLEDSRGPVEPARLAFAAVHVVLEDGYSDVPHELGLPVPAAELTPWIDSDATLSIRRRLDGLGFGIAEAMDTAQRFRLGWDNAIELVRRTGAAGLAQPMIAGAGVDHLDAVADEDALVEGVIFQARAIQEAGGLVILLPLAWLCEQGYGEQGYVRVYGRIAEALEGPVFVHWLGEMFLPTLSGYFPGDSFRRILAAHPEVLRGAKLSLLDDAKERELRADLATRDQVMLTGDDFHFGALMDGPPAQRMVELAGRQVGLGDFSHGLLGIFGGVAEPASVALSFLAHGDRQRYLQLMSPCERLGRHLFRSPTQHYKAGLAFLSWLDGHQHNPMLVQHEELARDRSHYLVAAGLASAAGCLTNAELAAERLDAFLSGA